MNQCPECKKEMEEVVYDGQSFLHCYSCGNNFFPNSTLNQISLKSAQELAQYHGNAPHDDTPRVCPYDHTVLTQMTNAESIPPDIILLQCTQCRGISINAEDTLIYKKSISIKIEYFKTWKIPYAPKAVALFSILLIVGVTLLTGYSTINQTKVSTQASDIITHVSVKDVNNTIIATFQTSRPMHSRLILSDTSEKIVATYQITKEPTTTHTLIEPIQSNQSTLFYTIIVTENGKEYATEKKLLPL
ncbi:MAG: hypothetical protein WCO06_02940 [Candidatus Roizmanbacteria bacterium]